MKQEKSMNDIFGNLNISSMGEGHLACVLLLDVSSSMRKDNGIINLNNAIKKFKEEICQDSIAKRKIDIAIVTFASKVEVVSDFCSITQMPIINLEAHGFTDMAAGIQTSIDLLKQRISFYHKLGTPCYRPWIFMITDGVATSTEIEMEACARRIKEEEQKGSSGHLMFWALGVNEYDPKQMQKLTPRVLELRDMDFSTIFDWLSKSMIFISKSRVNEKTRLDDVPENARVADINRKIDEGWT